MATPHSWKTSKKAADRAAIKERERERDMKMMRKRLARNFAGQEQDMR